MASTRPFQHVQQYRPRRSVFDLSYAKTMTHDMGQLIPIMCDEVVPGDKFTIGNQLVMRMQPMVAPILHEVNVFTHYFFVPYRLLWDKWEEHITRGINGDMTPAIPVWEPTDETIKPLGLWDYLGFPLVKLPALSCPIDFPRRAYNFVYNSYYRDETLQEEVELTQERILNRAWEKDYFTSSLPWQQRGTAPALPISGTTQAIWNQFPVTDMNPGPGSYVNAGFWKSTGAMPSQIAVNTSLGSDARQLEDIYKRNLNNNTIDLSSATTFDVADLRLAFSIQKWMERNARSGARYTEFLRSHFGVAPRDERLDRPEYIGGSRSPIIISEVLQTSETKQAPEPSPQGNMAGHGITADATFCGKYFAQEYGLIIGIMSVMPRTMYQQGINRQWLRRSSFDFYSPEFANLSEQGIEQMELYATTDDAENKKLFGYQGRYDEMRVKHNMVVGEMRDTFDYWHLGRKFATPPALNADFIECKPSETKRVFAVQNVPSLITSFANVIKAVRPLPIQSNPGLIDH